MYCLGFCGKLHVLGSVEAWILLYISYTDYHMLSLSLLWIAGRNRVIESDQIGKAVIKSFRSPLHMLVKTSGVK